MSLRTRLLLAVGATVAAAVVIAVSIAHVSASNQLRNETDEFLLERASRFDDASSQRPPTFPEGNSGFGDRGPGPLFEFDAVTQQLDAQGNVVRQVPGAPVLPVSAADRARAATGDGQHLSDVTIDGEHYRMITVGLTDDGAVQLARSLEETDDVLGALRTRFVFITIIGTALAALVAWLIARRFIRPVEDLTRASEYVATTQDLSAEIPVHGNDEVGRLATSFNTMLVALDTSREQQKQLVVDASHELRTPLTAIRTNIEFLERAEDLDPVQRKQLLAETRLELGELGDLMGELVDLATDVRSEEPVETVELASLVSDVVGRFRRRTTRPIELTIDDPGRVEGRPAMLDRAVSNLIDNAIKFSPDDGAVEVAVRGSSVVVADRGPGIAADDRARVFDRFYRATTARTLPGSGLGLAIVQQIARVHGGTVTLDDRPGGGTVARLEFPLAT